MRTNRPFFILSLFVVLALSMLLAGCGGNGNPAAPANTANATGAPAEQTDSSQAEPVTLEFWTIALQPTFNDYFNDLIAKYEESHPGVTVEWKDYPYDAISQRLLTSTASGKSPDVVNLNTEFASQLGSKGALLNLTEYLTDEERNSYFEGIYNSTVINGKAYSLPWYTGTEVLFMNKKLVEKAGLDPANPPKTREELIEWARQIHKQTGAAGYAQQLVSKLFPIDGISILNEDKTAAAFNTPEAEAMISQMRDLMKEGVVLKEDADFKKQIQYFSGQQVAFQLSGPTFINFIKTSAPDVYANTIAVQLPTGKANLRLSNSMDLVVPQKSKNPEQAVEFAAFVTNADNQTAFSKVANTLPSSKASIQDPFFTESDGTLEAEAKVVSSQSLDKATDYMVGVPNASDINSAIARGFQEILLNGADIKQTLDAVEKEVNRIISQGS
ncbi:sugar ABC transporter substrate-binding protein [Paenibacillus riograndensis]|uniref:Sugar ABC transporter substrate-binding protein n=1 Tax=Paenibacillus riograndensis TaxID=483937 RepID=A0A132TVI5_9BACL|nr:sugar ABC transporter substrate-binding protein [Paenibacillus riograndensis]KWX75244.1 sugar ABC transporter substrate-binding protein [Paenibacillus riograndensis]